MIQSHEFIFRDLGLVKKFSKNRYNTLMKNQNIVVIGGANLEYLVTSDHEIVPNTKNSVTMEELYAGSGLNYTLRLLRAGEAVFPILFVGDDYIGHQIKGIVSNALNIADESIEAFIQSEAFLISGVDTPKSIIMVEGNRRTVLSHDKNLQNLFRSFIEDRLNHTQSVSALIIGHIHSDKPAITQEFDKLSTLYAMQYFQNSDTLIYANIGASQITHGFGFWKSWLPMLDILQLNINEMKQLFHQPDQPRPTLQHIITILKTLNISAVITLDKFGAIGLMRDHYDTLFLAQPIDLGERFADSTGAGDAFCSGMVSVLNGKKNFSESDFKEAMEIARSWAVYACLSYGGANQCPDRETISHFHQEIIQESEVQRYHGEGIKDILSLVEGITANTPS